VSYPQTLRLTPDGVAIVVQRPTAQAVATAARAAIPRLTIDDANQLWIWWPVGRGTHLPLVEALADWIAWSLRMSDDKRTQVREMVGRSGVARG
jgi:hypothetical protein